MKKRKSARGSTAAQHLLATAVQDEQQGRLDSAVAGYRRCIEHDPGNAALLHRLALVLQRCGRTAEALVTLQQAARLAPTDPAIHGNLGNLLREAGEPDTAIAAYQEALRLAPGHANARFNLATTLAARGEPVLAEQHFRTLVQQHPRDAGARDALAGSLVALGRYDDAETELQVAMTLAPAAGALWATLGDVRLARGHHDGTGTDAETLEDAIAAYERAVELDPRHIEAWNNLSAARLKAGRHEQALEAAHQAQRIDTRYIKASINAAAALVGLHRWDDALRTIGAVLDQAPDSAAAQRLLARCFIGRDEPAQAISPLRRAIELDPEDIESRYHLGAVLITVGQHEEGTHTLDQLLAEHPEHAGAWARRGIAHVDAGNFDEAQRCLTTAATLEPELPEPWLHLPGLPGFHGQREQMEQAEQRLARAIDGAGNDTEHRAKLHFAIGRLLEARNEFEPAFVHYQAGNDLLRSMRPFDGPGFTELIASLIDTIDAGFLDKHRGWGSESEIPVFIVGMPRSGTTLVEQILASHSAVFGAGELAWLPRLVAELPQRLRDARAYPGCLGRLTGDATCELAARSLKDLQSLSPASQRVVDKLPGNYLHLGLIALLFPQARIIWTRRNAMDVCVSNYLQYFTHGHGYTLDLDALALVFRQHERLMAHWRRVLPLRIHELRYEELVAEQEHRSRQLFEFLGLPWEDGCLDFHRTERTVRTASHLQVRRPIYSDSVQRWRRYGPALERLREALERHDTGVPDQLPALECAGQR